MLADVLYAAIVAVCAFATGYRFGRVRKYVYGTCGPGAGRHSRQSGDGRVEFIMWQAGEHGHLTTFWQPFDEYWWADFEPYSDQ